MFYLKVAIYHKPPKHEVKTPNRNIKHHGELQILLDFAVRMVHKTFCVSS